MYGIDKILGILPLKDERFVTAHWKGYTMNIQYQTIHAVYVN